MEMPLHLTTNHLIIDSSNKSKQEINKKELETFCTRSICKQRMKYIQQNRLEGCLSMFWKVWTMEVGWEERMRTGKSEILLDGQRPHWYWQNAAYTWQQLLSCQDQTFLCTRLWTWTINLTILLLDPTLTVLTIHSFSRYTSSLVDGCINVCLEIIEDRCLSPALHMVAQQGSIRSSI